MALCPKCGAEKYDGAEFCFQCGAAFSEQMDTTAQENAVVVEDSKDPPKASIPQGQKKRMALIGGVVAVALVVALSVVSANQTKEAQEQVLLQEQQRAAQLAQEEQQERAAQELADKEAKDAAQAKIDRRAAPYTVFSVAAYEELAAVNPLAAKDSFDDEYVAVSGWVYDVVDENTFRVVTLESSYYSSEGYSVPYNKEYLVTCVRDQEEIASSEMKAFTSGEGVTVYGFVNVEENWAGQTVKIEQASFYGYDKERKAKHQGLELSCGEFAGWGKYDLCKGWREEWNGAIAGAYDSIDSWTDGPEAYVIEAAWQELENVLDSYDYYDYGYGTTPFEQEIYDAVDGMWDDIYGIDASDITGW